MGPAKYAEIRHLANMGQSIPAAAVLELIAEIDLLTPIVNRHASEVTMEKLEADRRRLRAEALAEAEAMRP